MMTLTEAQINEIAEELECGSKCYVHKKTKELVFVPDTLRNPDIDTDGWIEEIEKIEDNFFDYFEIEPPKSRDSFRIMEEFTETLDDSNSLKNMLYEALSRGKPFRNFKNIIDNSGEYRQKWFAFERQWLKEWVREKIEHINFDDK